MTEFPPDLIWEILRLLPVSSLLRFKCVSKSFHCTIDSRGFINLHLDSTFEHKTRRKLVFQKNPQLVPIHVLDFDYPFQPLPDFLLKDPPPEIDNGCENDDSNDEDSGSEDSENQCFKLYSRRFYGHCNGLVLMVERCWDGEAFKTRLGAWNPFTRKHWILQDHWDGNLIDCGFGYDPLTDDYKVLLVNEIKVWEDCHCCCHNHDELWILGLRSGCWKKVGNHNPSRRDVRRTTSDVCFADGSFYVVLSHKAIYAIDVSGEMLSLVSLPNDVHKGTHYIRDLQVIEGSICVGFVYWRSRGGNDDDEEATEELYVRKKNEDGEFFWMKLYSFTYETHRRNRNGIEGRKVGYSKRRDKLFILHNVLECKLYVYDFEDKSIKMLHNVDTKHRVQVIVCVESLASLDYYLVRKEEDNDDDDDDDDDEIKLDQV